MNTVLLLLGIALGLALHVARVLLANRRRDVAETPERGL